MEINYFISAKATATVQNINVSLSAEYQKEQAPEVISVVANGYLDDGKKFMNATLKYNPKSEDFNSINGSNVDSTQKMYLQLIYWVIIIFNCWKRIKIKAFINLSGMLFMYAQIRLKCMRLQKRYSTGKRWIWMKMRQNYSKPQ